MKKLVFVLIILTAAFCQATFAEDIISVNVDGNKISFDQPPAFENGCIFVPFRAILEPLGAKIYWDSDKKTITAVRKETTVSLTIGKEYIIVNGKKSTLNIAPKIIGGRVMVPAKAISEGFGATVTWNENNKSIGIYVETSPPNENSDDSIKNTIMYSKTIAFFQKFTSQKEWLIRFETKEEISSGKISDLFLTIAQKSDKMLLNLYSGEDYDISLINKEGNTYFVMNKERLYAVLESGTSVPGIAGLNISEYGFLPGGEEVKEIKNLTFSTGTQILDNTEYEYEEINDGERISKFYFLNNELIYIKSDIGKESEVFAKIIKTSYSAADSLFEIPSDFTLINF